ncbi:MAG: patatin-like phospholipase family protein [Gemmatimonadota bacterium]
MASPSNPPEDSDVADEAVEAEGDAERDPPERETAAQLPVEEPTLPEITSVAELLRMPVSDLNELLSERSQNDTLIDVAERHLLGTEIARLLPTVFAGLDGDALKEVSAAFHWRRLERGEVLFKEGSVGNAVYILASGRLRARVTQPDGTDRDVGEIVPGETVGEMAIITGRPRSATVVALRSSVLQECRRSDFLALVDRHPVLAQHLNRVLVRRLERANRDASPVQHRLSVAVVPLHDGLVPSDFAVGFLDALAGAGKVLRLDQAEVERRAGKGLSEADERLSDLKLLPWFEEQEAGHDFVLYQADPTMSDWTRRCLSQADRIILLGEADADPAVGEAEAEMERILEGARPPVHLVLVHPGDRDRPRGTQHWLESRELRSHHHVRRGRRSDVDRVFRLTTGRGLGLVLSGGGARGFAHIGVLQALDELGIPIDAVGGTSAGAAMAAQYAMGRSSSEIRDACHHEFVVRKPFKKYTLPVYSVAGRHLFDQVCRSIAEGRDVSDTWIPFFCTSCDLQTGEKVIHERGELWKAARASMSLPGVVPPVVDGDRLLVDGGVLDNLPEEEMVDFCGGRVIAVDVSGGAPVQVDVDYEQLPSPWSVLWHRVAPWRQPVRVPTLMDVLLRTATVSNTGQRAVEETVDLLLRPPVTAFGLLDFPALDRIIDVAAEHARVELAEWWATAERVLPQA